METDVTFMLCDPILAILLDFVSNISIVIDCVILRDMQYH